MVPPEETEASQEEKTEWVEDASDVSFFSVNEKFYSVQHHSIHVISCENDSFFSLDSSWVFLIRLLMTVAFTT